MSDPSPEDRAQQILRRAYEEQANEQFVLSRGRVRELEDCSAYLVTCAQNNTAVNRPAFDTLRRVCDYYEAQILVGPIRYKNPTGYDPDYEGHRDRWPEELHPYLCENLVRLHSKLIFMGHWRIQATRQRPLNGVEPISGASSAIYPHGRLQMKTVPTRAGELAKILYTTGSISELNYSSTDTGQKGEFHHTTGAVLVLKREGLFHLRHLNWSHHHGCLFDLNRCFTPGGMEVFERIPGIVQGDDHAKFADPQVTAARKRVYSIVRPREKVVHDVLDFFSGSHHHRSDPITQHVKARDGHSSVEDELNLTADHLEDTQPEGCTTVVVASNHHEHLLRWLQELDPRQDPKNAPLYHKLMGIMLERSEMRPNGVWKPDPFRIWCEEIRGLKGRYKWLERTESHVINDVEVSLHGDVGVNGARGTALQYARMGIKTATAHGHGPGIFDGNYSVGHGRLPADFQRGPDNWMPCDCLLLPNGKRQLIFYIKGEFGE